MTALDLCCGLGGWSEGLMLEGWRCVGVDIADFSANYPGEFIQADLLAWEGWQTLSPDLVVASPPCEEFSRHSMPWLKKKNPPEPSMALIDRCFEIGRKSHAWLILENVRGAQKWLGRSKANCGPFHLWGDVPAILPSVSKGKENFTGWNGGEMQRAERAKIPLELSRWIGRTFRQVNQELFV